MAERAHFYDEGIDAVIPTQQSVPARLIDPKIKNTSRLYYRIADVQAKQVSPDAWALLTDEDGFITEGTGSNFMMVKDGVLISPEPRNILLGITRGGIIDVAERVGVPFEERNIDPYDVINADEAFFSATSVVMLPVRTVNGHPLTAEPPGPVYLRLRDGFSEMVGFDFVSQAKRYAGTLDREPAAAL